MVLATLRLVRLLLPRIVIFLGLPALFRITVGSCRGMIPACYYLKNFVLALAPGQPPPRSAKTAVLKPKMHVPIALVVGTTDGEASSSSRLLPVLVRDNIREGLGIICPVCC